MFRKVAECPVCAEDLRSFEACETFFGQNVLVACNCGPVPIYQWVTAGEEALKRLARKLNG